MHSIPRRINNKGICGEIFPKELLEEHLYFCIHKLDISYIVVASVFLPVLTGLRDELDAVNLLETIREEYPECPGPGIEIEEDTSSG